MKKITNLIIIDASGSMGSKAEEIRGGLRLLFEEIKTDAAKGEAKIRTIVTQFSSPRHFKVLVNSKKANKLTDELADAYRPAGMTALFDAIGEGFTLVPDGQDDVLVTILTDGHENSSQEYDNKMVTELIQAKRKAGWTVTFMGTTEAAIQQARSWGVTAGNTIAMSDSKAGMRKSMRTYAAMRGQHYNRSVGKVYFNLDNLAKDNETKEDE